MIRLLYIDDEADSEKMKSKFEVFEGYGISVKSEHNIATVKHELESLIKNIDIIVVDLIMPPRGEFSMEETNGGSLTGTAIVKRIRKLNKKIPIIIVSILPRKSVTEEFLISYRVSDFLMKDLDVDQLISRIKSIVSNN